MADLLIRDVPDHVLRTIDANARRLGLSRTAYLRRQLAGEALGAPVSSADLAAFSETYADLADDEVMSRAWR